MGHFLHEGHQCLVARCANFSAQNFHLINNLGICSKVYSVLSENVKWLFMGESLSALSIKRNHVCVNSHFTGHCNSFSYSF